MSKVVEGILKAASVPVNPASFQDVKQYDLNQVEVDSINAWWDKKYPERFGQAFLMHRLEKDPVAHGNIMVAFHENSVCRVVYVFDMKDGERFEATDYGCF